jgi:class 3 adenylate cyclase
MLLAKVLDGDEFRVELADRGEKCLFLALEKPVDAFLIDIRMPGLDGIELCRRLRAIERYRIAPIMFITSEESEANLSEGFAAGATDLILKPVNPVVLHARLRAHLERVGYFYEVQQARDYLKRYISVRTQMVAEAYSMTGVLPAPEQTEVCVMFSDVRGFTNLSRVIGIGELFGELSRLLGMQVDLVHRHGGYIDKFGGDGIMAIFDGDDMALSACRCAVDILAAARSFGGHGYRLPVGIGLAMGTVMIGNIGSPEHLDYSAIGENVNLAARLCGHAEAGQILVSESVQAAAGQDPTVRFAPPISVRIKGFSDPVPVYAMELPGEGA